jgi:outer membrane protein OmpA-like peptidoglycan-associated protein
MQTITVNRVFLIVIVVFFMSSMIGCSHLEKGTNDRQGYLFYHKPLPEADRAVAEARRVGKDRECPAEFNAAKNMVDKAHQVYEACHTQEAMAMAQEAITKIKALCPAKPVTEAMPKPKVAAKVIVVVLEDIHFDFDKSTLTKEAQVILKRNVQVLQKSPNAKVRIAGYTSASGTEEYNQKLSERRANAVKEYLVKEGVVTPDRLSKIGYGEAKPAMYESAPKDLYSEAAKANMRVLFEIIVE